MTHACYGVSRFSPFLSFYESHQDNKTLEKLGEWVDEIDEKYFGKYRGVGATNSYLESISTPQLERKKSTATGTSSEADGGKDENRKGPVAVVADAGAKMKQV